MRSSSLIWMLIGRYTLPKGNLTTFALIVAVVGVAIGIAQMMVVLSVMSGFEDLFKANYTRITSEMVLQGRKLSHEEVKKFPQIQAVTPFFVAQGLIVAHGRVAGVVLEGIDLETSESVTPWQSVWVEGPINTRSMVGDWIWLGHAAAKKLQVHVGDNIEIVIAGAKKRKVIPVMVAAITKFGIYDHDLHWVRIDSNLFFRIFGQRDPFYKVKLISGVDIDHLRERIERDLKVTTRLWTELNRNIFLAVAHQKHLLFLVLQIVIALAGVNVVNLLVMNGHFRRRDVAILRAMGFRPSGVFGLFLSQGVLIGCFGILLGVVFGVALCFGVEYFQPVLLNESVYNVTKLPVTMRLSDTVSLCAVGLLICVVFSLFPAWKAMRMLPVEALRSE